MSTAPNPTRNALLGLALVAVAAGMVGMSYAAVPLYRIFCEVTGYGGTTQRATAGAGRVLEREVVVRLDGNISGLPWKFEPEAKEIRVKLGETSLMNFIAENTGSMPSSGTATFNVQPSVAGIYFNKIECFCFTEQRLQPGERVEMAVQFFVSPDMVEERELNGTRTITLSYTFFPVAGERQPVAQATGDENGKSL